jgi:integrase
MARKRARDPRLESDPPGYTTRANKDSSLSAYHRFRVGGEARMETIRSLPGAADPAAALRAACWVDYDAYMAAKRAGSLDERRELARSSAQPISEKLVEWVEEERRSWAKASYDNAVTQVSLRIEPWWGELTVGKITRRNIAAWRNWMMEPEQGYGKPLKAGGYNLPTVQAALRHFSAFCGWLVLTDGGLEANPCSSVKATDKDYVEDAQGKREPLTPLMIERISYAFAALTVKRGAGRGHPGVETPLSERVVWSHRIVLYLLAYVGVRPEDIGRACWGDCIDPETGRFETHLTVKRAKTEAGKKPRELFPEIIDALSILYRFSGSPPLEALIVVGSLGGAHNGRNWLRRVWRPTLTLAGVKRYRVPYAARHSAASNLVLAGWSARDGADQLGHSSPAFFLTRYASSMRDAAKRRNVPIGQQIREARIEVFGHDFSALAAQLDAAHAAAA